MYAHTADCDLGDNIPAQWYTLPAEGIEEQISAIDKPHMFVKTDVMIQLQSITTGPPVVIPYPNKRLIEDITETAVKQNENDINPLNPLYNYY